MVIINSELYRANQNGEKFFTDMLINVGVQLSQAVISPIVINQFFPSEVIGGVGGTRYYSPMSSNELAAPPDNNYKQFYFGMVSMTMLPVQWVAGSNQFDGFLSSPRIGGLGAYNDYQFFKTIVGAAPSPEVNKNNIYKWEGVGFSYLRFDASGTTANLDVEFLFTGVRITW